MDHIQPVSRFDHTKTEEIKLCWNWQNLRPLGKRENRMKSDRMTHPQQCLPLVVAEKKREPSPSIGRLSGFTGSSVFL